MHLEYIAKVRDYDDYLCKIFLKDQDHCSINRPSLWTAIFFINTPDRFVMLFSFNYLLCKVLFVIELTLISINKVYSTYIYIYIYMLIPNFTEKITPNNMLAQLAMLANSVAVRLLIQKWAIVQHK